MRSLILAFVLGVIAIGVMPSVTEARCRKQKCHAATCCAPYAQAVVCCGQPVVTQVAVNPTPPPVVYQPVNVTYQAACTTDCGGCGKQRGHRRR